MTTSQTKFKITRNGLLVFYFHVWVDDQVDQDAIPGTDFMVSARIRLDLADGTLTLPNEVKIYFAGKRFPYRLTMQDHDEWSILRVTGFHTMYRLPDNPSNPITSLR